MSTELQQQQHHFVDQSDYSSNLNNLSNNNNNNKATSLENVSPNDVNNNASSDINTDDYNLFKDLFNFYDQTGTGYITIEKFIAITKENMPDNLKNDDELNIFVDELDPLKTGRIDFEQFVIGMKKLTTSSNDTEKCNEISYSKH
jgi:Ca2+-binding EF-hand superfamily protein